MQEVVFFYETPIDVFTTLFLVIFGLFLMEVLRKQFEVSFQKAFFLFLWHLFFLGCYICFSYIDLNDSTQYYYKGLGENITLSLGTDCVEFLTLVLYKAFSFSYTNMSLFYNFFGYIGLLAFYASLRQLVQHKSIVYKRLAFLVVLLPGVSFWSVAIGKDSIALMSIGLALWSVLNLKKRFWLMIFAIGVMFLIRPHIGGIMIGSLLLLYLFDKNRRLSTKVFLSMIFIVVTLVSSVLVLDKLRLDISSVDSIVSYIEKRQSYNQDGGGGIDISTMTLPEQLFTYIFRPLPYEAHSLFALGASIENLFLLGLFLFFVKRYFTHRINPLFDKNLIFIYSFVIITSIALAMTTANLGIAVRQKWMFMPFLIYIWFLYIAGVRKVEKSLDKEMICEK
ncbi:EpsG family protein [Aliarcobacter cryaerophilus]|uniref:EpsG family protein n=1 Tax=Aliarcobacter cryaerophilus TaxID=28198 RepID=UPI003AF3AFC0